MGCSNGKMVKVSPVGETTMSDQDILKSSKKKLSNDADESLNSADRPSRSATSKGSKHSHDSGYIGNDLEDNDIDEYANIITENSEGAIVQQIENSFQAPDLGKHVFINKQRQKNLLKL